MSDEPESKEFEALLWRSSTAEKPTDAVRERALAAAIAAGAPGGSGGPGGATAPAVKGLTVGAKAAIAAVVVIGGAVGLFVMFGPSAAAPLPIAPVVPVASASVAAAVSAMPIVVAAPVDSAPAVEIGAAPPSASTDPPAPAAPRAGSPAPKVLTLADEVVAIDGARASLSRGDTAGSLRTLDAYDRSFPHGTLAPEATVLRIEALAAAGDRARAVTTARAFLATHPSSPLAARVRRALATIDAGSE